MIYSDSQVAIKTLKNVSLTAVLVHKCRELLTKISSRSRVTTSWDMVENRIANELARAGRELITSDIL